MKESGPRQGTVTNHTKLVHGAERAQPLVGSAGAKSNRTGLQ